MATNNCLKLSIHALGGQGGGVLSGWLVQIGIENGFYVQGTSVPGVAQRTGATVYYLEFFREDVVQGQARDPVLALMPTPGDVDIVVASELMEAGRAILRGLVDQDRTTLITSIHRVYAIAEKSAMGNGLGNSGKLLASARTKAKRFIGFDMDAAADRTGSVISSVMLGAIAGSGVLPFPREAFEAVIRAGGVAVSSNLAGFEAGYAAAMLGDGADKPGTEREPVALMPTTDAGRPLYSRLIAEFPAEARFLITEGVRRTVDYQDAAYAHLYLDRLKPIAALGGDADLLRETARYLALWMSYEDVIRVADLKTRDTRFERVRSEVKAEENQIVHVTEFMHPRYQEVCETLPRGLGQWLSQSPRTEKLFRPFFRSGRHVTTSSLGWFLALRFLARYKRFRRSSLRYAQEQQRIGAWLDGVLAAACSDRDVALELVECQRLVKGYSDTHSRGLRNFGLVWTAAAQARDVGMAGQALAAHIRTLREAALKDENGSALAEALKQAA